MPIKIEGRGEDGGTNEQEEAEYFPAKLFPYKSLSYWFQRPVQATLRRNGETEWIQSQVKV